MLVDPKDDDMKDLLERATAGYQVVNIQLRKCIETTIDITWFIG